MEKEHDIVHFPQSYSRSISVNRGVHTVQRDNKIKSCPLQESLFHLELSQKNTVPHNKHSSLKITIPLKYIKVWSLFPLGQCNYPFEPRDSCLMLVLSSMPDQAPKYQNWSQKNKWEGNPPQEYLRLVNRVPRTQIYPVTLTTKTPQTFACQNPLWTSAWTSCCTIFLPKYRITKSQTITQHFSKLTVT